MIASALPTALASTTTSMGHLIPPASPRRKSMYALVSSCIIAFAMRNVAASLTLGFLSSTALGMVNCDVMESNEHGILVLKGHQESIDKGKNRADVITIIVPVFWLPDALKITAELSEDGGGVFITIQALATPFFANHREVLGVMAPFASQETEKTYTTEAMRLLSNANCTRQRLSVAFKESVTCNKSNFNEKAEGKYELTMNVASVMATDPLFMDQDGDPLKFPLSFAFGRLVVDGRKKRAELPKNDNTTVIARMMSGIGDFPIDQSNSFRVSEAYEFQVLVELI
jgi:hypothetical protein